MLKHMIYNVFTAFLFCTACSSPPVQNEIQSTPTITQLDPTQIELQRIQQELSLLQEENLKQKEQSTPTTQSFIWIKWVLVADSLIFFLLGAGFGSKAKTVSNLQKGFPHETKERSRNRKTTTVT